MSKLHEESISIYEAVKNVDNGKYVMPAFQRQFVWDMERIEKLWDSVLQGYPISTFLFWHIDETNVLKDTSFCSFMRDIRFSSDKKPDEVNYELRSADFSLTNTAVLDGQQRLTAFYITLLGETSLRPKYQRTSSYGRINTKLYIELNKDRVNTQDEFNVKKYGIAFSDKIGKIEPTQFEIKKIMDDKFKNKETRDSAIESEIRFVPVDSKDYARALLKLLCEKIFDEKLIRYTEIYDMDSDDALEMFVRFNSGGKELKKSEITMSILEAYWPLAKTEFGLFLRNSAYNNFDADFIIRTAHMIYGDVVKSNISMQIANDLKNNWQDLLCAYNNTADLLKQYNIYVSRFSNSWNVIIPIVFSVYFHPTDYMNYAEGIITYLKRAVLFSFFKSGTTAKLQTMKNAIMGFDYEITVDMLNQIAELSVSEAKIEELINQEKGSRLAGELLYFISLDWIKQGVNAPRYEQDHLHPYDRFSQSAPIGIRIVDWVECKKLANRIPNLHYLEGRENGSKNNMPLIDYYNEMNELQQKEFKEKSFIPDDVSLDITGFKEFYEKRKELLIAKIKGILK